MGKKRKAGAVRKAKKPSAKTPEWLTVCPNCGYPQKQLAALQKAAHRLGRAPDLRISCPICFYHGPAIEVRAEQYREMKFAHQKLPERHEGKLVWPEILLILL